MWRRQSTALARELADCKEDNQQLHSRADQCLSELEAMSRQCAQLKDDKHGVQQHAEDVSRSKALLQQSLQDQNAVVRCRL